MKKDLTEVVFILDRSGSMGGLESDTIGGFNSMIEKQRKEKGEALISTVLFDNVSEVIHDRVPLSDIAPLTEKQYYVRGCTALIDAIGGAIHHISEVHRYVRDEDVPEHTLFVITTDGLENASHKYTADEVRKTIEQKKELGWEFIFIGANIDSVETAKHFGIDRDHAVKFRNDSRGIAVNYEAVSDAICCMRAGAAPKASWKESIEADYAERGNDENGAASAPDRKTGGKRGLFGFVKH